MIDAIGSVLEIGDKVAVARHMWRGRDVACVGIIKKLSPQSCMVMITSSPEHLPEDLQKGRCQDHEWNIEIRVKYTKMIRM